MSETPLWYYVSIPMTKEFTFEDLRPVEEELRESGVYFDTAYLFGEHEAREWHLDFALYGPMTGLEIIDYLDGKGITFESSEKVPTKGWTYDAELKDWAHVGEVE